MNGGSSASFLSTALNQKLQEEGGKQYAEDAKRNDLDNSVIDYHTDEKAGQ